MMARSLQVILCTLFLQSSTALVEFTKSKLYDETDFSTQIVNIPSFCDVGCRIYVSCPDSSAEIAKNILVLDYIHGQTSLYDISKLKKGDEKGYFEVKVGSIVVQFVNTNTGTVTAPIAVWVLRNDADNIGYASVYEAADLKTVDTPDWATVMSAEPFTLRSKTEGPMILVSTLSGFDAITNRADECTYVLEQLDPEINSDIVVRVQSPLISLNFDDVDYPTSTVAIHATLGSDELDFTGISFAASPGYIGCKGGKTFRSSLYPVTTIFEYPKFDRDVAMTTELNTDTAHPVSISDNSNEYNLFGSAATGSNNIARTLQPSNGLKISWTRNKNDLDQSFLIRLTPLNTSSPIITTLLPEIPETTPEATTQAEAVKTTTAAPADLIVTTESTSTTTTSVVDHSSCPAGFELVRDGECRGSSGKTSSYNDAAFNDIVEKCKEVNGQPIIIHNDEHQSYWKNWREQDGSVSSDFPIGLTCNTKNKRWEWVDGSRVDYKPSRGYFDSDLNKNCKTGCGWFMNATGYWRKHCNHNSFESNVFCTAQLHQPSTTCSKGPWKEGEMIYSPGYPYKASTPCDFVLTVEAGKRVELTIVSLEANSCCDKLTLNEDGAGTSYHVNLTGDVHDSVYTTKSSNTMKVSWKPSGGVNIKGVQMKFRAV